MMIKSRRHQNFLEVWGKIFQSTDCNQRFECLRSRCRIGGEKKFDKYEYFTHNKTPCSVDGGDFNLEGPSTIQSLAHPTYELYLHGLGQFWEWNYRLCKPLIPTIVRIRKPNFAIHKS